MQAVAASDVILANPTHVAVALRYKRGMMRAPKVMAKGADLMAQRIKEHGRKLGIAVIESPALARDLYASVEVGKDIPVRLYRSVARIISQIQRLKPSAPRPAPTSTLSAPAARA
jgi:flagellar biosynthetic protein FlhB